MTQIGNVLLFCLLYFGCLIGTTTAQGCIKEISEDVCPQREGFDPDCEERCLRDYPMRVASGCYLRNTGTLLSFFGIRSFICRCEMSSSFCEVGGGEMAVKRAFSLSTVKEHSTLRRLSTKADCSLPSKSLQCLDSFVSTRCSWQKSTGADWYGAVPRVQQLPFAPGEAPVNGYLVGMVRDGVSTLSVESCPSLCSNGEVKVSMRLWRAPWVQAELCFREAETLLCAPIQVNNGKLVNEVIPQTSHFSVSVRFSNLSDSTVILLDDLSLQFEPCTIKEEKKKITEKVEKREENSIDSVLPLHQSSHQSFCPEGDCTRLAVHAPSSLIDRTCLGRSAHTKCKAKCRSADDNGSTARCVRQKEYPFAKRCVCQMRRMPIKMVRRPKQENLVDGGEEDIENNSILHSDNTAPNDKGLCSISKDACDDYCARSSINSSGVCSSDPLPVCRCLTCLDTVCDFEKGHPCGWTDLRTVSDQFNNVSIASKRDHDNRYGLTRMIPRSYSGLIRKGWVDGPVLLSVDVFPSEKLQVRICVDSLSRCQDQMVRAKTWNRVTARIKVTRTDKLFLLFYNDSQMDKTVALDNISLRSGPCFRRRI